jgi:glycosyltransferase involved in cell wall biosynthesis
VIPYLDRRAWQRFERAIYSQVRAVVVFTERDRRGVAQRAGQTPIFRIPLGTTVPEQALHPLGRTPSSLLYVGNFEHSPNVAAALRLATRIFPAVHARYPDVELCIVGDHPPAVLRELQTEHIHITGRVPDVMPYLDHAALVIAPLDYGGGMRVKVLEALAAGKAVVASPLAAEGLDVGEGGPLALAETDDEFVHCIVQLLAHPTQRERLAAQARGWACDHLSWDKTVEQYEALYARLLSWTPAVVDA